MCPAAIILRTRFRLVGGALCDLLFMLSFARRFFMQLLRLGFLLRVVDHQVVDGAPLTKGACRILRCVAHRAITMSDYRVARLHCMQLVDAGYSEAWTECRELAYADNACSESSVGIDERY